LLYITDAKGALYGIQLVLEKMRGSKELKKVLDTYIETLKIYDKSYSRVCELENKILKKCWRILKKERRKRNRKFFCNPSAISQLSK
jgi:hypothetical protein